MKNHSNIIPVIAVLLLAATLVLESCKGRHYAGKPPRGERAVKLPCSGKHFQSDKNYFRVNSSGESLDQMTSKKKALSNARSELAGAIHTTVKVLGDNFVESTEFNNREEILEKFIENNRTVIRQELLGTKMVCELLTKTKGGRFKTYIALELPGEELVSNLYDRLQKKEWLKVDYKYEKFKNDFNREMENFENQSM